MSTKNTKQRLGSRLGQKPDNRCNFYCKCHSHCLIVN